SMRAVPIAHRVLDPKRGEFQALERRARRGDVDAQRAVGTEPARPVERVGELVHVAVVAIRAAAYSPQNAARETTLEVRVIGERQVARESDAALARGDRFRMQ